MATPVYNTVAGESRGAAIEGFDSMLAATLTVTADAGLIDGVAKPAVSVTVVAATNTFVGYLVSEDGDGTYTITHTADDVAATAVLALAAAEALDVPAGGTGLFVGSADDTDAEYPFSLSVRGKLPPVSSAG